MYRYIFSVILIACAGFFILYAFIIASQRVSPVISPFVSELIPTLEEKQEKTWTLLLTGDIIPARVVNQKMVAMNDFGWPLRQIQHVFRDADVTLIDLEAPLLENCPITNEGFTFCGDKKFALSLQDAGVDVANLANNHSLNYGWEGIEETQTYLDELGILTTGFTMVSDTSLLDSCVESIQCSSFTIMTIQGKTIGFLGYNAVGQHMNEDIIKTQIEKADSLVDVLIVSVHWGKEYERYPVPDASLAPDDPVLWGRKFVDWGADVIAGNHPHWYQSVEWYTNKHNEKKPIFYALGNTVFDQEWSEETKEGVLVRLHFSGDRILPEQTEFVPIGIRDYGEAYVLEGEKKEAIESFYRLIMNTILPS
jgi:poly-gamma-glutamate synthesis protein (capsule biosynthesis protein)